jgi:hypothetical protein
MRRITPEQLNELVDKMADQLAEHQVRMMLTSLFEAANSVGNSVSVAELGAKEPSWRCVGVSIWTLIQPLSNRQTP